METIRSKTAVLLSCALQVGGDARKGIDEEGHRLVVGERLGSFSSCEMTCWMPLVIRRRLANSVVAIYVRARRLKKLVRGMELERAGGWPGAEGTAADRST